jgi:hypothetical protein
LTSISYLMLIAYELVLLTFSLGVLILALPIPLRSLKAWSGRLISDSILAFVLISLFWTLISFSNSLPLMFGWSWEEFNAWLTHVLGLLLAFKAVIAAVIAAARAFYLSQLVSTLLWPIDKIINIIILTFTTIYALSIVVKKSYLYLAALGIALYALPLRVGKSAGAWLLSFALVFNAGLPLLPAFITTTTNTEPPQLEDLGVSFAQVRILGAGNYPVTKGFVHVYINNTGGFEEIARYPVGGDGYLIDKYDVGYVSIPTRVPTYWVLEIDGVLVPLHPLPLSPTSDNLTMTGYNLTLRAPSILFQEGYKAVLTSSRQLLELNRSANRLSVSIYLNNGDFIEIEVPETCTAYFQTNSTRITVEEGSWEWLGLNGLYYRLEAVKPGIVSLNVSFQGVCKEEPQLPSAKDYILDYLGLAGFSSKTLPNLVVGFILLPSIFIFILSSITFALARLLGGRERIIPRL